MAARPGVPAGMGWNAGSRTQQAREKRGCYEGPCRQGINLLTALPTEDLKCKTRRHCEKNGDNEDAASVSHSFYHIGIER
ncbi:hypothetical protein MRX96_017618 [Rhipicephalus microplus]